ncbi:unnamed protein product [Rotaria socialis]
MGRKAFSIDTKKGIILLRDTCMSQHEISRKLNVSHHCARQTIRKFNKLHTRSTKLGAGRRSKVTRRQKRVIKLQQLRDDTLSLNDLVRYAQTSLNLNISRQTVSRILHEFVQSPQLMENKGDLLIYLYLSFYLLALEIQNETGIQYPTNSIRPNYTWERAMKIDF